MEIAEIIKFAVDIGITPVLLFMFVRYFITQDEKRNASVMAEYQKAQEKAADIEKAAKERENMLLAESQRREELIRTEAMEREKLIRREAEKREGILLTNLERVTDTMGKISESMQEIQQTIGKIDDRLERLEVGVRQYGQA